MNKQAQNALESGIQPGKPKRAKPDRRWTLLFIGDHGKVITLKRFKGIVFFAGLVFVLSIAAVVLLYGYNLSINSKNEKLESSLELYQKRIQTLRHEKEILMARLVLAESRVKESIDSTPDSETPKPWLANEQNEPPQKESVEVAAKIDKTPAASPPAEPEPEPEPPDMNLSVNVEDFNILKLSDPNKIKIQFKIKNTSPNSQRVSGHAIVVLKGDDLKPKMWLAVPPMGLVGGKPTGQQRGGSFSINYFRTMRFTTNRPRSPLDYNVAAVYVYTGEGQLLLEEEFPAEIPVPRAPVSESSSSSPATSDSSPPTSNSSPPTSDSSPPARTLGDPKHTGDDPQTEEKATGSQKQSPLY
ncbi:MAG: hypothetical protein JRF72_10625 [Deltaproteobacteria bacterium]|jgi:hypothetical protein|nr:hypothetical protein [Deltaproteobacteria bacterium]